LAIEKKEVNVMASHATNLIITNTTDSLITNTYVLEVDSFDWDGNSRPDINFQGVAIGIGQTMTQREELNANAQSAWFRIVFAFANNHLISFRNDQYDARQSFNRSYGLEGPNASGYAMHQTSGDEKNTFTLTKI
jgi:hypothetical protein